MTPGRGGENELAMHILEWHHGDCITTNNEKLLSGAGTVGPHLHSWNSCMECMLEFTACVCLDLLHGLHAEFTV